MLLTKRKRHKTNNKFINNFYPHIIISKSDKLLKSLSINQLIAIISICFFVIFGFLAFYLPQQLPQESTNSSKIKKSNSNKKSDIIIMNKNNNNNNNIDKNGHIQIFYYPWYGDIVNDGQYIHWNHDILPHWEASINEKYEIGKKYDVSQDEIGASYYPELGPYSSSNKDIIIKHYQMLIKSNISVIIVSWHSPIAIKNNPDKSFADKDKITSNNLDLLFKYSLNYNIKIAIHLEPYDKRTAISTYQDLKYLNDKYGKHKNYYKSPKHGNKPFFYLYDSYKMDNNQWAKLFIKGIDDNLCVRDTELDGIFLGLYLNKNPSETHIIQSGFDGFYTYFAADGFTDGSSPQKNWNNIAKWSLQNNLIFIPSLGPGYNDLRVRPWNKQNTKNRNNGNYYKKYWNQVFNINDNLIKEMNKKKPKQLIAKMEEKENEKKEDDLQKKESKAVINYVSITSFNEWHEGTQIEPSIPKISKNGYKYLDFESEGGPDAYMKMTHEFANKLLQQVT